MTARRTSARTWGPFRAASISRTWALGPLPAAATPLVKRQEEMRPCPVRRCLRACLGDAAGRGRGAARRAGGGRSPATAASRDTAPGLGCLNWQRQPSPRKHMHAHTQSLCGQTNPCAQANTHMPNERAQPQMTLYMHTAGRRTPRRAHLPAYTRCTHQAQPAGLHTHSAPAHTYKHKCVTCTPIVHTHTKPGVRSRSKHSWVLKSTHSTVAAPKSGGGALATLPPTPLHPSQVTPNSPGVHVKIEASANPLTEFPTH